MRLNRYFIYTTSPNGETSLWEVMLAHSEEEALDSCYLADGETLHHIEVKPFMPEAFRLINIIENELGASLNDDMKDAIVDIIYG